MGLQKTEVFIASRFDEFAALREHLVRKLAQSELMAPIDLGHGRAGHEPPLNECLSRVERAELMVLLLGETYGPLAPRKTKSFTHLEYDHAMRDGSKTRVLVYRIARAPVTANAGNPVPETWLTELSDAQRISTLDGTKDPVTLATEIMAEVALCVCDLWMGRVSEEEEGILGDAADAPDDAFDDSEVDSLEAAEAGARGLEGEGTEEETRAEPDFVQRHPATVAALEQRAEAERAIALREFGIAIQHLRRALELRPLDGPSNFWLARLYLVLGRHGRYGHGVTLAQRAANIASDAQMPYRAADAYLLAARLACELGDMGAAHDAVNRALEQRSDFAKAHLERARVFCRQGGRAEAVAAVRQAFQRHSSRLHEALRDPHLRSIRPELRELLRAETARWVEDVRRLLDHERTLAGLAGEDATEVALEAEGDLGLNRLRQLGQQSIARQHAIVKRLVASAEAARRDSMPEVRSSPAAELSVVRERLARELEAARADEQKALEELEQARKLPELVDWTVLLPLGLGVFLGYWMPWLALGLAVFGVGTGLGVRNFVLSRRRLAQARARWTAAQARHANVTARRAQLEEQHATAGAYLGSLQEQCAELRAVAEQALGVFEERSVAMPARYQPFDTLRRAQRGNVVRVSPQAIERFEQQYERKVERDDEFWLDAACPAGFALYQVTAAERRRLRLSRANAYDAA